MAGKRKAPEAFAAALFDTPEGLKFAREMFNAAKKAALEARNEPELRRFFALEPLLEAAEAEMEKKGPF